MTDIQTPEFGATGKPFDPLSSADQFYYQQLKDKAEGLPPLSTDKPNVKREEPVAVTPEPLHKETPEPSPYPIDALGSIGADAAKAIQRVIQAPDAICGQSIIAGIAQIAQGHADISIDGRRRPTSCFFVSVAETGERKVLLMMWQRSR